MKFGFDLFKFSYIPSPELENVEKDIGVLEEIWGAKDSWDNK